MAEVITRLKVDNSGYDQKIKSAQRSLDQFGLKGTEVGQKMSGLTQMLNVNIGALSKWSLGLGAASAALKVAGDAFKSNEVLMDDWNGTMAGAQAIYEGFLVSLNTGDFSGFVSRMGDISRAAREAYDALDELQTYNAFNQINMADARRGMTAALAGYRTGEYTKEDVQAAADNMKAQLAERQAKELDAYMKAIGSKATKAGVSAELLAQYLQGSYGDYKDVKETQMPTKQVWNSSTRSMIEEYDREAATPLQKLGEMLRNLNDDQLNNLQALGAQARMTADEIAQVDKQTARVFGQKTGTKTEKKGLTMEQDVALTNREVLGMLDKPREGKGYVSVLEEEEDTYKEMYPLLLARRQAIDDINAKIAEMNNVLALSTDANTQAWATDQLKEYEAELDKMNGKMVTTATGTADAWSAAASAVSSVSGAISSLEDPAAKIAGIIGQAVATVALSFASSLKGTVTPWDYIAGAAAGLATMISTISAIKSVTAEYHADGGFIGGGPKGSDVIPMWGTPGELVLNRSQQTALAGQLQGASSGMGNMTLRTEISGENLAIVLDNNNRRRGRGKSVR